MHTGVSDSLATALPVIIRGDRATTSIDTKKPDMTKRKRPEEHEPEAAAPAEGLTDAEAAQYDRQIRLWGVAAQRRLGGARVLVCGMSGLAAEVVKNIVLSGVGEVVLLDDAAATADDLAAQFFLRADDVEAGRNRAEASRDRVQQLNPMVRVSADARAVAELDGAAVAGFDVVCLVGQGTAEQIRINALCRAAERPVLFFAGEVHGMYGLFVEDLGVQFQYSRELPHQGRVDPDAPAPPPRLAMHKATYASLETVLSAPWSEIARFKSVSRALYAILGLRLAKDGATGADAIAAAIQEKVAGDAAAAAKKLEVPRDTVEALARWHGAALAPVCAIVGGVLGQEIVKVISKTDTPLLNVFVYDGAAGGGFIEAVGAGNAVGLDADGGVQ